MMNPFIVMCAPNGARRDKDDHPAIPITAAELADCAAVILDAGASLIHVHVRDEDGGHTLDAGRYRAAISAVRQAVGDELVLQVTTEACGMYTAPEQKAVVRELRPEAVSLALRELCPDDADEREAAAFYSWLQVNGVMAQHILYSPEDARRFEDLRGRGVIPDPRPLVLIVLGRYGAEVDGDPADVDASVACLGDDVSWTACCFGPTENAAVARAARKGGHARVGFENNVVLPDGSPAASNADLVRLAVASGRSNGRPPATADDIRAMFLS